MTLTEDDFTDEQHDKLEEIATEAGKSIDTLYTSTEQALEWSLQVDPDEADESDMDDAINLVEQANTDAMRDSGEEFIAIITGFSDLTDYNRGIRAFTQSLREIKESGEPQTVEVPDEGGGTVEEEISPTDKIDEMVKYSQNGNKLYRFAMGDAIGNTDFFKQVGPNTVRAWEEGDELVQQIDGDVYRLVDFRTHVLNYGEFEDNDNHGDALEPSYEREVYGCLYRRDDDGNIDLDSGEAFKLVINDDNDRAMAVDGVPDELIQTPRPIALYANDSGDVDELGRRVLYPTAATELSADNALDIEYDRADLQDDYRDIIADTKFGQPLDPTKLEEVAKDTSTFNYENVTLCGPVTNVGRGRSFQMSTFSADPIDVMAPSEDDVPNENAVVIVTGSPNISYNDQTEEDELTFWANTVVVTDDPHADASVSAVTGDETTDDADDAVDETAVDDSIEQDNAFAE